jgi:hypothetical protein
MKIAFVLYGVSLCFEKSFEYYNNQIFNILYAYNIYFDVYIHALSDDSSRINGIKKYFNIKTANLHICNMDYKSTRREIKAMFDSHSSKREMDIDFAMDMYSKYMCFESVMPECNYNYVFFSHLDNIFFRNINIKDILDLKPRECIVSNHNLVSNIDTKLGIVIFEDAHLYANTFKSMLKDQNLINVYTPAYFYLILCIHYKFKLVYKKKIYDEWDTSCPENDVENGVENDVECEQCKPYNSRFSIERESDNRQAINEYHYKKNTCIYTIVLGDYEQKIHLFERTRPSKNVQMYIFSDNIHSLNRCRNYYITPIFVDTKAVSARHMQRKIKANPQKYLKTECTNTIYIDDNIIIQDFNELIQCGYRYRMYSMVCFEHPQRKDAYEEGREVVAQKLETKKNVDKIFEMMQKDNIVSNQLSETNVLFRNNLKNIDFAKRWEILLDICKIDQIFFDYILVLFKIKFIQLSHSEKIKYVAVNPHTGNNIERHKDSKK